MGETIAMKNDGSLLLKSKYPKMPLWEYLTSECLNIFKFLETEHGFVVNRIDADIRECTVEFKKEEIKVGIWFERGNRPEVNIKKGNKSVFFEQLIKQYCKDNKLPPAPILNNENQEKEYYVSVLRHYSEVLKVYATEMLGETSGGRF